VGAWLARILCWEPSSPGGLLGVILVEVGGSFPLWWGVTLHLPNCALAVLEKFKRNNMNTMHWPVETKKLTCGKKYKKGGKDVGRKKKENYRGAGAGHFTFIKMVGCNVLAEEKKTLPKTWNNGKRGEPKGGTA